jgi:hypothetical protein
MAAEPAHQHPAYDQPPVQTYKPPQQTYQQPAYHQPYAGQPYPAPYAVREPQVGWWKLIVGIVFVALSFFICFGLAVGIVLIGWFVVDWFKWRQWSERRRVY